MQEAKSEPNEIESAPVASAADPLAPSSSAPSEPEAEGEIPPTSFIGFVLAPLAIVLAIVGIMWTVWYLTYDRKTVADYAVELRSEDRTVRWQAALGLVESDQASDQLVPVLEEMLDSSGEDQELQGVVWTTRDMLKTPEERKVNLRWYAAAALGKIGGERATLRLLDLLSDSDDGVRFYAVHSLGRLREPRAVSRLEAILAGDADAGSRMAACWALGEIGDAAAVEPLRKALTDDSAEDVRWNAALALARFCDESGRPTLESMLVSPNVHTRDQARRALTILQKCGGGAATP